MNVMATKTRPVKSRDVKLWRWLQGSIVNGILILFSFSCMFPLVWIFYSSLKTEAEFANSIISLPEKLQFSNYMEAIQLTNMPLLMWNSIRVTSISVVLIVIIAFITGYFLSRFEFKGRRLIFVYYLFGMLIPIHGLLVPVYLLFSKIGLTDQWFTPVIPYIGYNLSLPILLIASFIQGIPGEIEEAAAIDGSGFSRTLFTIILPVSLPVITTVAILQFFACWNEFSFALILLSKESLRTVPLGMSFFKSQHSTNYPSLMAAIILSMLPILAIYFSFSSKIIKGVTAGAIKG
ncbi:MAG: transporter permease [Paenibacillus sp.]|nr:transporter permease [Paenibacillus sp.]